jgi:signal transduction histidine kinase/DNA-binding response OmpR family regulator/HAMP domain-containing protein
MLVRDALKAGLITGLMFLVLVFVVLGVRLLSNGLFQQVWPLAFVPVFLTGIVAVRRAGPGVKGPLNALQVGAIAGLTAAIVSLLAYVLVFAVQNVFFPSNAGAWNLTTVVAEAPLFVPPSALWYEFPFRFPFSWPFQRTVSEGVTVSRIPTAWFWFLVLGPTLAALQAVMYYGLVRMAHVGEASAAHIARYRASFQNKLMLGFLILGGLILAVGWLGYGAVESMHLELHGGRTVQHLAHHTSSLRNTFSAEREALARLRAVPDEATLQEIAGSAKAFTDEVAHVRQVPPPPHTLEELPSGGQRLLQELNQRRPAALEIEARFAELDKATVQILDLYRAGSTAEAAALLPTLTPLEDAVDERLLALESELDADLGTWMYLLDSERHGQEMVMMVLVLVAAGLAFPLGYVFSRVVVRPVNEVSVGLERVGAGDFSSRVEVENRDELGELAQHVNRMSQELAGLYEQLEARTRELARLVEEQQALAEVSQAVNSSLDVQTVLTTIVAHAVQITETNAGAIYEFNEATERFQLRATHQMSEELVAAIQSTDIDLEDTVVGRSARTRQAIQVPDILDEASVKMYEILGRAGYRAVLAVPLLREDRIVGALVVRRTSPGEFEPRTVELLQAFATQSVLAIQNARLFQEIDEKGRELEAASQHKSEFLANMSHELRTPLNAIIGYSELLHEEAEDLGQEDFIPDLEKIQAAGRHLLGLINDILDLSKIEAGRMDLYVESFDVPTLIRDIAAIVQPLVEKNSNTLQVHCPNDLGLMRADATKVRQSLFNLLSNASKFTEKGTVSLDVARERADNRDWFTFTVTDSGIGIAPEHLDRLFQAFTQAEASTTRRFGGTGLGLAISRHFCQMMGGDISVASEAGKGSTFAIRLPAAVEDEAAAAAPDAPPFASLAIADSRISFASTVLVIDDDPAIHELLKRSLKIDGVRIVAALGGAEGLAMARQIRPDVITLDVLMPTMDGWAVLTALKADPALADIPVIMLSILDDKNMGFALGAADYLTKPIDRERLEMAFRKYLPESTHRPILVVDDDAATRETIRRMLEKDGWTVAEAENGRAGLERAEANPPALILLDLMMPEMDGFEFLTRVRKGSAGHDVPILIITAKDLTAEDHLRLNGYVNAIVQKEGRGRDELLAEIRNLVLVCLRQPTASQA